MTDRSSGATAKSTRSCRYLRWGHFSMRRQLGGEDIAVVDYELVGKIRASRCWSIEDNIEAQKRAKAKNDR